MQFHTESLYRFKASPCPSSNFLPLAVWCLRALEQCKINHRFMSIYFSCFQEMLANKESDFRKWIPAQLFFYDILECHVTVNGWISIPVHVFDCLRCPVFDRLQFCILASLVSRPAGSLGMRLALLRYNHSIIRPLLMKFMFLVTHPRIILMAASIGHYWWRYVIIGHMI